MRQKNLKKRLPVSYLLFICFLILGLGACVTTEQTRSAKPSGFLKNYSQLRKGGGERAQLFYINRNVNFDAYSKVMIEPVTIWHGEGSDLSSVPRDELQRMADYLYSATRKELGSILSIVERPGPGVMRVRMAITTAKGSNVPMDIVTNVLPPAIAIDWGKKLATGTHAFVGKAAIEAEVLDSLSYVRLAAAVDERAGGKTFEGKTMMCKRLSTTGRTVSKSG
ncbi:MAG: DUF3313 domain-containing protein [Desulfobacterales bacterium]